MKIKEVNYKINPYNQEEFTEKTFFVMNNYLKKSKGNQRLRNQLQKIVGEIKSPVGLDEKITVLGQVYYFVRDNIQYMNDEQAYHEIIGKVANVELIQAPWILLQTKKGDCDDFALLTAALLQELGFKPKFLSVSNRQDGVLSHAVCFIHASDLEGEKPLSEHTGVVLDNSQHDKMEIFLKYHALKNLTNWRFF